MKNFRIGRRFFQLALTKLGDDVNCRGGATTIEQNSHGFLAGLTHFWLDMKHKSDQNG